MTDRGNVAPHVRQVHSVRIQSTAMSAVILHVAIAVAAFLDRRTDIVKRLGLALREVQQAVMARIKSAWDRKAKLDVYDDPIAELHSSIRQKVRQTDTPLRNVVKK